MNIQKEKPHFKKLRSKSFGPANAGSEGEQQGRFTRPCFLI